MTILTPFLRALFFCLFFFPVVAFADANTETNAENAIQEIEIDFPVSKVRFSDLNRVWQMLLREVDAPSHFPPPRIVLDWDVPLIAKMGFQFPTAEFPDIALQISVAPRTLDMEPWEIVLYGIGHELTHYLFLMQENNFDLQKEIFVNEVKHHCNRRFMEVTRRVADEIWNIYHDDVDRNRMNNEVIRSCGRHGGQ